MEKHLLSALILISLMVVTAGTQESKPPNSEPTQPERLESPYATPTPISPIDSPSPTATSPSGLTGMNWSTDTWTAIASIVAFAALIQPWLLALWRKLFNRGTLDIHEAGTIEIGFGNFGPSIGLIGTLRALHKDMFVQWAKLRLVRADESAREFEWRTFRNTKLSFGTTAGQSAEVLFDIPFSFLVSSLQPHRFNILFSDVRAIESAFPIAQKLQKEWQFRIQGLDSPDLIVNATIPTAALKKLRREHSDFLSSETYEETFALLSELNYWRAGKYRLTMVIQTARPSRSIQKTWSFTVSEAEIEKLQNNVRALLEELCGLPVPASEYGFASASYNS